MVTIFFGILLLSVSFCQEIEPYNWLKNLPKPWTLNEDEINEILPGFKTYFPDFQDRLKAIARWRINTPYEIFKLGEEIDPDPDPIIRLDVSDCTAHVLTTLAFAHEKTFSEAKQKMIEIHYKTDSLGRSSPTYRARWHYTSDRIDANPYTVNITDSLFKKEALTRANLTLNKKEDGSEFLKLNWNRTANFYYIPSNLIDDNLLDKLPEVVGVAFVKNSYKKLGILIAHEGMILENKKLLHASKEAGKTVEVDLLDYYFRESGPLFDGIMIYKYVEIPS